MSRADAYHTPMESPVKKYLSWSSNDKCFTYYDKEVKENKKVALPLFLIHLHGMSTIKGWHDASESGIYSNEVRSTKTEELNVRAFKGGNLVKGIYQDIKLKVQSLGGVYYASVYAFLDNEIVNIALKGSALMTWSDFSKENSKSFLGNYIDINGSLEGKKGSIKYTTPTFTVGEPIPSGSSELAEVAYESLMLYLNSKKKAAEASNEGNLEDAFTLAPPREFITQEFPVLEAAGKDDLPF